MSLNTVKENKEVLKESFEQYRQEIQRFNEVVDSAIGYVVDKVMTLKELKSADVALRMGVTASAIRMVRTGKRSLPLCRLFKFAEAADLCLGDLILLIESKVRPDDSEKKEKAQAVWYQLFRESSILL